MTDYLSEYIDYLRNEKKLSENSISAYQRDMRQFFSHLEHRGLEKAEEMTNADIVSYIMKLKEHGRSRSTLNRKTASVRGYVDFLCSRGIIDRNENPVDGIQPPKMEKEEIDYLSIDEVNNLLDLPEKNIRGIRDKAILELLYGTGIRVTELIEMRLTDLNFRIGFVTCNGSYGKARIIPLGIMCKEALMDYVKNSRPKLLLHNTKNTKNIEVNQNNSNNNYIDVSNGENINDYLFINYHGDKLTRQGLWKIVRGYGRSSGIGERLTPQILRNSFAAHMIQNGADLKSIQELMGYEDATTVQIYLSIKKNRIKEVYDRTHPRA